MDDERRIEGEDAAQASAAAGIAEGEDVGTLGAPEELREEDVQEGDALNDRAD